MLPFLAVIECFCGDSDRRIFQFQYPNSNFLFLRSDRNLTLCDCEPDENGTFVSSFHYPTSSV